MSVPDTALPMSPAGAVGAMVSGTITGAIVAQLSPSPEGIQPAAATITLSTLTPLSMPVIFIVCRPVVNDRSDLDAVSPF